MSMQRHMSSFAIALTAAVGASFAIHSVLNAPNAQTRIATMPVVISVEDIPAGRAIELTSLAIARWPLGTVPSGAYAAVDSVIGRVARRAIFKGEVLVPNRLAPDSAALIRK